MTRIPDRNNVVRYIMCDNTSGADYRILPDMNPRKKNGCCTNPGVITDPDILVVLKAPGAKLRFLRMISSGDDHIRAEHNLISHINMTIINKSQI